jgi:hypothetical protein
VSPNNTQGDGGGSTEVSRDIELFITLYFRKNIYGGFESLLNTRSKYVIGISGIK